MPAIFKDVAKPVTDLLTNDYVFQAQKLKLKTKTANGLELTTEGTLKGSKGVSAKLSAKFSPFAGINIKKLCVTTEGRFQTEAVLENAVEGVSFTVKAEEGAGAPPAGELVVDYKNNKAAVQASVDVTDPSGPTVYGSGTFVYDAFLVGAEAKYCTGLDGGSASLADYNVALGYATGDLSATVATKKKASQVTLSLHQKYSKDIELATEYAHASKLLTLGATYKVDANLKVQGKVDSKGIVSANALQTIASGIQLITSVELDAKNFAGAEAGKFGLSLVLG
jgi:hypothetical protein